MLALKAQSWGVLTDRLSMKSYRFEAILQNSGWVEDVVVRLDNCGRIVSISQGGAADENFGGFALPAFQNAHSHAFQYAMAGLAENHVGEDDFWSWRETMYRLAENLSPDQIKTIATMLYAEMLRNGYANVAEFHYLHHARDGKPYDNPARIGESLVEAAAEAGIKITLIPVFYQKGGFGLEPNPRQKRFISKNFDDYARLFKASAEACKQYENANIAVGVHSLRAVESKDILRVVNDLPSEVPFHMHVAEQIREVEDCLEFLGKRPVEWLLENVPLSERFHLVHATHLTESETEKLAKSGANVVLCPSTEGNLGDGVFPLRSFQEHGGNWSLGTDSHIGLNPFEELRLLDYGQRLISHKRNTFPQNSGQFAIEKTVIAGRRAMNNFETEFFAVGAPFDACIIDADAPLLRNAAPESRASTIVYTAGRENIIGTFVNGRLIQTDEKYRKIREDFSACLKKICQF